MYDNSYCFRVAWHLSKFDFPLVLIIIIIIIIINRFPPLFAFSTVMVGKLNFQQGSGYAYFHFDVLTL